MYPSDSNGFQSGPIFVCYRPLLMEYGLWDQLRVDHGKEWVLMLFVQEKLAHLRYNTSKPPHRQTTSKLVCLYLMLDNCVNATC